jgi:hypothetical protein
LQEKGSVRGVASFLGISISAVYERCGVYGITVYPKVVVKVPEE